MAIGLIYSVLVVGCGGGGSSMLPGSTSSAGTRSVGLSSIGVTSTSSTGSTGSASSDPHQSADFGMWWMIPTSSTQAQQFSWLAPMPHNGELAMANQLSLPASKMLVPFNSIITRSTDDQMNAVPYSQALANNWLLWTTPISGNDYLVDPAAPGYADAWAANAIAMARKFNASYVLADSVDYSLTWHSSMASKYDTDAKWQAAMTQFLQTVYTDVHAAGLKFCINLGSGYNRSWQNAPCSTWLKYSDAAINEFFTMNLNSGKPTVCFSTSVTDMQINDVQTTQKRAILTVQALPSDPAYTQKVKYALSAYLICRKEGDTMILHDGKAITECTFWNTQFPAAEKLGHYLAPPQKVAGVWVRQYANGIVLLNDTDSDISIPASSQNKTANIPKVAARTGMIVMQK